MAGPNILNLLSGLAGGGGGILSALGGTGNLSGLAGLGSVLGGMGGPSGGQHGAGLDLSALASLTAMLGQFQPAAAPPPEEEAPVVDVEPEPVLEADPAAAQPDPPPEGEPSAQPGNAHTPKSGQKSAGKKTARKQAGPHGPSQKKPPLSTEQLLGLLTALGQMAPASPDPAPTAEPHAAAPNEAGYYGENGETAYADTYGDAYGPAYGDLYPETDLEEWWNQANGSCQNCSLPCPRAGLRLPEYQEVRSRAAHWSRY